MINMKTVWDYTEMAEAYLKRPDYSLEAINAIIKMSGIPPNGKICDVGAGAAHLTIMLASRGFSIIAIEPNDAMRANGMERTNQFPAVQWHEGVGEDTKMGSGLFDMVTYGSSFNVCDRQQALKESHRILKSAGYFVCMWNHRELADPLQRQIEEIIINSVPDYTYGSRREDQANIIIQSGLFGGVEFIEYPVVHRIKASDFVEGWHSHGNLRRQAGKKFESIIVEIGNVVKQAVGEDDCIDVPYMTRVWMAEKYD